MKNKLVSISILLFLIIGISLVFGATLFNETFTTSPFNLTGSNSFNCSTGNYSTKFMQEHALLQLDEPWYCFSSSAKKLEYSSYSGNQINTQYGLKASVENYTGTGSDFLSSIQNDSFNFNIADSDYISFYCDAENFSFSNNEKWWLALTDYNRTNYPVVISLTNGGCSVSLIPIYPSGDCCEMTDIMGYDCTGGKKTFSATANTIKSVCSYNSTSFGNISRIDSVRNTYVNSNSTYYLDDLLIGDTGYYIFDGITDQMDSLNFTEYNFTPQVDETIKFTSHFNYTFGYDYLTPSLNNNAFVSLQNAGDNLILVFDDSDAVRGQGIDTSLRFTPEQNGFSDQIIESIIGFNFERLNFTSTSTNWMTMDLQFYDTASEGFVTTRLSLAGTLASSCILYYTNSTLTHEYSINTSEVINTCLPSYSVGQLYLRNATININYRSGASAPYTAYIKDLLDYFSFGNITSEANTTTTVKFQEPFGTGYNFDVTEGSCLESANGYADSQFSGFSPKYTGGEHDWICWLNDSSGSPSIDYSDISDTSYIYTDLGINHTVSSANPVVSSWATSGDYNIDMSNGVSDRFKFTCDTQDQTHGYSYLLLAKNSLTGIDQDYAGYISLTNGGCLYNESLPYQQDPTKVPCCELSAIAGSDCSSGKTTVDFSEQDIEDNCVDTGFADLSVREIDRLEFMTYKLSSGQDSIYFDDLYLYTTSIVDNNTLPTIYTMDGTPNPAQINETVNFNMGISDPDNLASEIYSAFDCNNDGILEYNWTLNGTTPIYSCTYNESGGYTARGWTTDTAHYPNYNTTFTSSITVNQSEETVLGGDCIGFSAPDCTGNCYFNDDFNYAYPVECNDWAGTANNLNPTADALKIINVPAQYYNIEVDGAEIPQGTITENEYKNFDVSFDITLNHYSNVQFDILNSDLTKYSAFIIFSNYNAIVYDPSPHTIASLPEGQTHNIKAHVNLDTDTVLWYVDDILEYSGNFFDGAQDSARRFSISWASPLAIFTVDNFQIAYGDLGENATQPAEAVSYTYNPALFCAINWTSNDTGHRFSQQNCEDRGYSTGYPLISLCVPRACIQDTSSVIVSWATSNIFRTIIIVTAIILIAPLLIALRPK